MSEPQVTKVTIFTMQVCVPQSFSDEQVEHFANTDTPAGTMNGWRIRRQAEYTIPNQKERAPCDQRPDCVHLLLDC